MKKGTRNQILASRPLHIRLITGFPKVLGALLPVLAFVMFSGPSLAAEGVLLGVSGNVSVRYFGTDRPAEIGLRLRPGHVVRSLGGEASGILEDGRMFRVAQDEEYTVPGDLATGPSGLLASRAMDTIRETISRGRGYRDVQPFPEAGGIRLRFPHNAHLLPGDLKFEWKTLESVDRVEITVKSPSPALRFAFMPAKGQSGAFLPPEAPELLPGVRYFWKVREAGSFTGEPLASEIAWFSISEPDRVEEMRSFERAVDVMTFLGEAERNILRAVILISYGLYHRAEGLLREGLENFPDDQGVRYLLAGVHGQMKMPEPAGIISQPPSTPQ